MSHELFCKLFVDSNIDKEILISQITELAQGTRENGSVRAKWGIIDVTRNDEHDELRKQDPAEGFLFFRYIAETEPCSSDFLEEYLQSLSLIITGLRKNGAKVVAASDFEDQLPL